MLIYGVGPVDIPPPGPVERPPTGPVDTPRLVTRHNETVFLNNGA